MRTIPSATSAIRAFCENSGQCARILERLKARLAGRRLRFMEVCGTHTVAFFQSGLRSLLPDNISHLSGPGCPVCVTHDSEVALFIGLAGRDDVLLATFGDLLRVPDPNGRSLKHASAAGARIEIVYSPLDALALARENPGRTVVFLGIGFETTAPGVAATILAARQAGLENFTVLSMHKLVAPALRLLLAESGADIDAFLLPGHVATVTGLAPFAFLKERGKPAAVCGFEPLDLLLALDNLAGQLVSGRASVANVYQRAVNDGGNPRALAIMNTVFEACDARWRGLGAIEASGLAIRPEYAEFDAIKRFSLSLPETGPVPGCRCGDVLKGKITPRQCPLFGKACTPVNPVGPCMVSTEGGCAAHYKYSE